MPSWSTSNYPGPLQMARSPSHLCGAPFFDQIICFSSHQGTPSVCLESCLVPEAGFGDHISAEGSKQKLELSFPAAKGPPRDWMLQEGHWQACLGLSRRPEEARFPRRPWELVLLSPPRSELHNHPLIGNDVHASQLIAEILTSPCFCHCHW